MTMTMIQAAPCASDLGEREINAAPDDQGHRINGSWKNGKWKFHFTLSTTKGMETRDFDAKLWTCFYIPIIDGPPN
jgi:hypothetical protein